MNIDLRKARKNDLEIDFFKLINNSVFGKTTENVKKKTDIRLITIETRKKLLTKKFISKTNEKNSSTYK